MTAITNKNIMEQQPPRPKGILDIFFGFAKNLTPDRQLDYTYYLLWIIFLAFVFMFITNVWRVINGDWYSIIWAMVGFAISILQFFSLRSMYEMRQFKKGNKEIKEEKLESVEEMLKGFSKDVKGGKQ